MKITQKTISNGNVNLWR